MHIRRQPLIPLLASALSCATVATALTCLQASDRSKTSYEAKAATVEWPEWRGPNGLGHAHPTITGLPTHWSESDQVAWKTPIPGRGWSTPVIQGSQVWMTTAMETSASPDSIALRLKANTGDQPLTLLDSVEYRAICVDRDTGRIRLDVLLFTEKEPQWVHTLNSYASPSPVIEHGRLYAHFGASGTVCLDTESGKVVWLQSDLKIQHENGPGSSPILWGDLLIVQMDGSDFQYVVALNKHTGDVAWKTDRSGTMHENPQLKKSYGTPLVLELDNQPQLISTGANWLYSYAPDTGKELWKLPYDTLGFSISSRMVSGHGMGFFSTGFMRPELLAVRLVKDPERAVIWRYSRGVPTMSSPLLIGDELYFVSDSGGFLTCLDAHTGKENYRERLGGDHSASPLFADGKIYVPGRNGITTVIRPGPKFELLAKNTLDGSQMASFAVADTSLFIRTDGALYRIQADSDPDHSSEARTN